MTERLFVLAPLADVAPELVPPGLGEPVRSIAARLATAAPDAVVAIGSWDPVAMAWR